MNLTTLMRISIAAYLFGLHAVIEIVAACYYFLTNGTYADYGAALVMGGIYGYVAYGLKTSRSKTLLSMAILFASFDIVLYLLTGGVSILESDSLDGASLASLIGTALTSVVPVVLLLSKGVREHFSSQSGSD